MLKLNNIKKIYKVSDENFYALKGLTINFRQNEFVSILGPSGCGKTTLLNIIGGLDKYFEGDLLINQKSTKKFGDRDWDTYRNHSVGFVFQSHNLIPHQSILSNVELALSIAGIDKEERTRRAKETLDKVGLKGLYKKKPNQLSGGQCQRVAIARALVNEPDILLADEPTGALDTKTAIQIMDLIKEVSKERLVIMVTHNPELATDYSTRIIKLQDGKLIEDSNPYLDDNVEIISNVKSIKKSKMSFITSFKLSLQNLLSKSKRTFITAVAASVGIVGVSAVLSVSNGMNAFIDNMQEDMLSTSPITIRERGTDYAALLDELPFMQTMNLLSNSGPGFVEIHDHLQQLIDRLQRGNDGRFENDINQNYMDFLRSMPVEYNATKIFQFGIDVSNNIFVNHRQDDYDYSVLKALSAVQELYLALLNQIPGVDNRLSNSFRRLRTPLFQMFPNETNILNQYEEVAGRLATNKNEVVVVLDNNGRISDLTLSKLGLLSQEEFINNLFRTLGLPYNNDLIRNEIKTEELLNTTFTWFNNDVVFEENDTNEEEYKNRPFNFNHVFNDGIPSNLESGYDYLELEVVGVLRLRDTMSFGALSPGFLFTQDFTEFMLEKSSESKIVNYMSTLESRESAGPLDTYVPAYTIESWIADSGNTGILYQMKVPRIPLGVVTTYEAEKWWFSVGSFHTAQRRTLNMRQVAGNSVPTRIDIFSNTFEERESILEFLIIWNSDIDIVLEDRTIYRDARENIVYQDTLGVMSSLLGSLVNMISMILIGFISLSLVVSSFMIAIITYLSVTERIKEIGVIRSLGGRKSDVSRLFNTETFLIGFFSGLISIVVTLGLGLLVNAVVYAFLGISGIFAFTIMHAILMTTLSVSLNLIAGFIPSRMAATKDPVLALRSE